jgi:alpha-L-rhamnosidase
MEIHDASLDPHGWNEEGFDDSEWIIPVVLKDQNHWDDFQQRNLPFLTHDEISAKSVLWKKSLSHDEKIYSFRVKTKDQKRGDFNTQKRVFAYTWIYSPNRQRVDVGTWWGEFFLNGDGPLDRIDTPTEIINRQTMSLNLKKGWNFFFVKYDVVWASWEFYLAIPEQAGLVFSANQKMDDDVLFRTAGPFTENEESIVKVQPLPFDSPDDLPVLSVGWVDKTASYHAQNPAWNVAWSQFDKTLASEPWQIHDISIEPNKPTALAFDMGGKMLGRIFIEYEAPDGTQFDIAFSEDLTLTVPGCLNVLVFTLL